MMSVIYYGEIRSDKLETWGSNKEPHEILVSNIEIHRLGGCDFLQHAKHIFSDEVQVDWGSFAYKCTKDQLSELAQITKCEIPKLDCLDETIIYGIVFIECY